jgi:hypothetical protein
MKARLDGKMTRVSLQPKKRYGTKHVAPQHGGRIVIRAKSDVPISLYVFHEDDFDKHAEEVDKSLSLVTKTGILDDSTFIYLDPGTHFYTVAECESEDKEAEAEYGAMWFGNGIG